MQSHDRVHHQKPIPKEMRWEQFWRIYLERGFLVWGSMLLLVTNLRRFIPEIK